MTYSEETSRAALLLTNRLVDVDAKPLTAKEYWTLLDRVDDPAELLHLPVDEIRDRVDGDVHAERLRRLLDAGAAFAFERERLEEGGVTVVSSFDDAFPPRLRERLGGSCPPFLLAAGPLDWLDGPALGIVGSRDTSTGMLAVADAAAGAAVSRGWAVVSGLARGVDQVSMKGALERGGRVIGVPAEGIRRVARNADVRRHVHAGELCLISPYGPDAPFRPGTAMGRNKIVYACSRTTLVVATDEGTGGTWSGAVEALAHRYATVAVWTGNGAPDANHALARRGAVSIDDVSRALELPDAHSFAEPAPQPTLF